MRSPLARDGQAAAFALDLLNGALRTEADVSLHEAIVVETQQAQNATQNSRQVEDLGQGLAAKRHNHANDAGHTQTYEVKTIRRGGS